MAEYSLFKQRCQVHSWRSTVGGAAHAEQYGTQLVKQTQKRMELRIFEASTGNVRTCHQCSSSQTILSPEETGVLGGIFLQYPVVMAEKC